MPEMLFCMTRTITQADYVRVAVNEDAMLTWLQENPKENNWIQPVSDKDDICVDDARRYSKPTPSCATTGASTKPPENRARAGPSWESSAQRTRTRT